MIDPRVETPPIPTNAQVTSVFELPRTAAENCAVSPAGTEILPGVMETAVCVALGVEPVALVCARLQPRLKIRRLKHEKMHTLPNRAFFDLRGNIGHLAVQRPDWF